MSAPIPPRPQDTSKGETKGSAMVLFWHVVPVLMALALLALLVVTSDLTLDQIDDVLSALTVDRIAAFFAVSVIMLGLSSIKWRIAMQHLPASPTTVPSLSASFFYTCLGAALSLVLMPHAAKPAGRALGARIHGAHPVKRSITASVFEQAFDLVMIIGFATFGLAFFAPSAIPFVVLLFMVGAIAVVAIARHPNLMPKWAHIADALRLLHGPVAPRLATISLALYLLTALRAGIVAVPAGLVLLPTDFFASFSLVQLSRIIAVTPMGLGITDWTWAGVLSLFDITLSVSAAFVLANRCLNALSILLALALSTPLALIDRHRHL